MRWDIMKKKVFISVGIILFISIIAFTTLARTYLKKNDSVKIGKDSYSVFYSGSNDVRLLCDYNSPFKKQTRFITVFGITFTDSLKNRNFICVRDILGNRVFKNDNYEIPSFPQSEQVDKIVIFDNNDEHIIENRKEIGFLVNYFNSLLGNVSADINQANADTVIYAISNECGVAFNLTGCGRYLSESENGQFYIESISHRVVLPDYIMNIIEGN